jgi:hypothetical protein
MQSLSWEADSHSTIQEITRFFTEAEGSLPCSQKPAVELYHESDESSPQLPTLFL